MVTTHSIVRRAVAKSRSFLVGSQRLLGGRKHTVSTAFPILPNAAAPPPPHPHRCPPPGLPCCRLQARAGPIGRPSNKSQGFCFCFPPAELFSAQTTQQTHDTSHLPSPVLCPAASSCALSSFRISSIHPNRSRGVPTGVHRRILEQRTSGPLSLHRQRSALPFCAAARVITVSLPSGCPRFLHFISSCPLRVFSRPSHRIHKTFWQGTPAGYRSLHLVRHVELQLCPPTAASLAGEPPAIWALICADCPRTRRGFPSQGRPRRRVHGAL